MLDAWEHLPDIPLTLVGAGPLLAQVRRRAAGPNLRHVTVTGELSHEKVLEMIGRAGMLIFPSVCYEGLPCVALEALAAGVPVVASDIGTQAEVVADGVSGLLFKAGDATALVRTARMLQGSPELAARLAKGARRDFASRYSADRSYDRLVDVYKSVGAT